jgi:Ca-activated chloride channel family protein
MSFRNPWLLLTLLILVGAVGAWLLAERRRARYAVRFTNMEVLATVAGGRSWRRLVPPTLFTLALASLFIAVARPQVSRLVPRNEATVILVVDSSRSMQAQDVRPTRLGAAQNAIRTFLDRAPRQLRVGLIVFAGEAQVATPPTTDHELVRESVDTLDEFQVFGGTAIGDALQAAVELGQRTISETGASGTGAQGASGRAPRTLAATRTRGGAPLVSILFLSDGHQTRGALQPLEGAQLAKNAGIPVYTIALGTQEGTVSGGGFGFGGPSSGGFGGQRFPVPPDPVTLRQIAEVTGGQFTEARTAGAVKAAYSKLGSRLGRRPAESEVTFLFVAAAAALLVAAGVFSALWSPRLP